MLSEHFLNQLKDRKKFVRPTPSVPGGEEGLLLTATCALSSNEIGNTLEGVGFHKK